MSETTREPGPPEGRRWAPAPRADLPEVEEGLAERTDSYAIFPSDTTEFEPESGTDLGENSSWQAIENALIGGEPSEGQFNLAMAAHVALAGGPRTVLIALSERGPIVVDDRPLGSDADHAAAEAFAKDMLALLRLLRAGDATVVGFAQDVAFVVVAHGIWVSITTHAPAKVGHALSVLQHLPETNK